jgi:hypothetical protein
MAPGTLYLHIGLHKTGTTFLQNVLRANRDELRRQGLEYPGGPGVPVQALAVWDLQGRRPRGVDDGRIAGSWRALVDHLGASSSPRALVSVERLSVSTPRQARAVVDAFPDSEVHVIVTARDIARVAVSAWQEDIKNDNAWTWQEFADSITDPARAAQNPARGFWMRQDLPRVCAVWETVVPIERLHVVTVPPPGADPGLLLQRLCSVIGVDAASLTERPAWANETVGVAGTEVLRQVNTRLEGRLNQRQYDRAVKRVLVHLMARRTGPERFGLPADRMEWATAWTDATIKTLEARGYPVIGDLDELRPCDPAGVRRPDDASRDEVLDAALDALSLLVEEHATTLWSRRKPDTVRADARAGGASWARGVAFRSQRRAAALADRSPLVARVAGVVLRHRYRTGSRAGRRADEERGAGG